MRPDTRALLREFYAPFNAKLAQMLGDDRWGRGGQSDCGYFRTSPGLVTVDQPASLAQLLALLLAR
jgi:hypothetical protein